jgi:hypothetical protein
MVSIRKETQMKKLTLIGIWFAVLAGFVSSAHAAKTKTGSSAKSDHLVVEFAKGSNELSAAAQSKLAQFIAKEKMKGAIDDVAVAVWSDKPYPSQANQDLADSDKKLASERGNYVENILEKKLQVSDVDVINMAEKSDWWSKAFNTQENQVKTLFTPDSNAPVKEEAFRAIRVSAAPTKAVVIVRFDDAVNNKTAPTTN